MNIQILDSWLREHLKTKATPQEIAKNLSLTSVSIERINAYKDDLVYDIEITTNRPDLASVIGLAREAAAVLPQVGIDATFAPSVVREEKNAIQNNKVTVDIQNDSKLIYRICAVVMEVTMKETPDYMKDRLESAGIRSLNNIIDVTNYVMREVGHPTHVFDFDRIRTGKIVVRESKQGEKIQTLDGKTYSLPGGDIVADDGTGRIIDLLGIMGLENSVVTKDTKRILFFIDNNDTTRLRKTSMTLGIRTEAAQLNEKGLDPELAMKALTRGIQLYEDIADGKVISDIIDIYPNKVKTHDVSVSLQKIADVMGISVKATQVKDILESLGFTIIQSGDIVTATVPTSRVKDVSLPEDIIEEIARVYGYHNIPNELPPIQGLEPMNIALSDFYWEKRVKDAMKYWGYTEVYTYSMVPEVLYEGSLEDAVTISNPLSEEFVYMRCTLVPSLLHTVSENSDRDILMIYEIANIYEKRANDLPRERRMLAGILKKPKVSFFEVKGLIEQIILEANIEDLSFKPTDQGATGAGVYIGDKHIGEIEILDENLINFELDFEEIINHANLKKTFTPLAKYPPIIEDMAVVADEEVATGDILDLIENESGLVKEVTLLDKYKDTRTFHIIYQDPQKNLSNEDVKTVRERIIAVLKKEYKATIK